MTMDSNAARLFRINKILLVAVGLWPHQVGLERISILTTTILCMSTQSFLQIAGMLAAWEDQDVFMEAIPPVLVDFLCGAKIINFIKNSEKMKKLLLTLEEDWKTLKGRAEIDVMTNYTNFGRKMTVLYTVVLYGTMGPFMVIPVVPLVINALGLTNETLPRQLMFRVDFIIDPDKYYFFLLAHSYMCTIAFITVTVGIDTILIMYVQHACGCFGMVGYRLEHLVDGFDDEVDVCPAKSDDISYHNMVDCVVQHKHALEYSKLIEEANYVSFFFQLGVNMICISFTGFQTVMQMDRPEVSFRYGAFTVVQLSILFLQSFPGQLLYDNSTQVAQYVNESKWYYTSLRTRKLINLMTLRSRIPSFLTAGRFYILNLENFSAVVKTSMSYLTVLTSVK